MTTQVVVFSVMLFGASGLVLDFGRVYSEHSAMQSYTDQAAIAAASELDGEFDSVDRAVDAVFGSNGSAPFGKNAQFSRSDEGSNAFNIEYLMFVSSLSTDSGTQTSFSDLSGENVLYAAFANGSFGGIKENAAANAVYVVAVAAKRSVNNSLIQLINTVDSNNVARANVVQTVSAAKRKELHCGNFSNLVMCNPFENDSSETFENFFVTNELTTKATQFELRAENLILSQASLLRRAEMKSSGQVTAICETDTTLPGGVVGKSAEDIALNQVICHMAAASPTRYCIGEEIAVVGAEPEVITTALNTAFDMWDEPINDVLSWNTNGDPLQASLPLFQPDLNITKGKLRLAQTSATERDIETNTANNIPLSSRLNYTATLGVFDNRLSACFRQNNSSSCTGSREYMGNPSSRLNFFGFYGAYWRDHLIENGFGSIPAGTSMHEMYLGEKSIHHSNVDGRSFAVHPSALNHEAGEFVDTGMGEDGSLGDLTSSGLLEDHHYANYSFPLLTDNNRRVFGVTVVNCLNTRQSEGQTLAPVVGHLDVHLLHPPTVHCDANAAPNTNNEVCSNDTIDRTDLYLEFVRPTDKTESAYSVLVR
ncbi:MAG: pilus assembly protein TadG-related protein [Pikeienuella sp.]